MFEQYRLHGQARSSEPLRYLSKSRRASRIGTPDVCARTTCRTDDERRASSTAHGSARLLNVEPS